MRIEEIDSNFKKEECNQLADKVCYTIPNYQFDLYGVFFDKELGSI